MTKINDVINLLSNLDDPEILSAEDYDLLNLGVEIICKYKEIEKIIKTAGIFAFDVPVVRRIAEVINNENGR